MCNRGPRAVAVLLAALALAAGCGAGRTQADQDRDGGVLAGTLRNVWLAGTGFALDQRLTLSGGDIPGGQGLQFHGSVSSGVLKGSAAQFSYRLEQGQQGSARYDMVVASGLLYVRRQSASAWKATGLSGATTLFPALRLDLLRETVLLASSVSSGSVARIDSGLARRYVVRPAPDQLQQLQSVTLDSTAAQQFMRTASGEVDVYLAFPGDRLARVEVHLTGLDPSNGERQEVASVLTLHPATVGAIRPPADAQQVAVGDILG
jgi:hypothetical protein